MSADFDPYYKWLGIPPEEQPPNHYRLLGLPLFEEDGDVIQNAVDQRMAHIRTFQGGKNSEHSQKILNELSHAKVNLLTPDQRQQYDFKLRSELSQPAMVAAPPLPQPALPEPALPPASPPPTGAVAAQVPSSAATSPAMDVAGPRIFRGTRRPPKQWLPLLLSVGAALALAGVLGAVYAVGGFSAREIDSVSSQDPDSPIDVTPEVKIDGDPSGPKPEGTGGDADTNRQPQPKTETAPVGSAPDYALQFDERDYVILEHTNDMLSWRKPFTAEVWCRLPDLKVESSIFGTWGRRESANRFPLTGWGVSVAPNTGGKMQLAIRYVDEQSRPKVYRVGLDAKALADWSHLAVCNDGDSITLWLNGTKLDQFEIMELAAADQAPLLASLGSDPSQLGMGTAVSEVRGFRISNQSRYTEPFAPHREFAEDAAAVVTLDFSKPLPRRIGYLTQGDSGLHGVHWVGADGGILANHGPRISTTLTTWKSTSGSLLIEKSGSGWSYAMQGRGTVAQLLEVERTEQYVELAAIGDARRRYRVGKTNVRNWEYLSAKWIDADPGGWIGDVKPSMAASVDLLKEFRRNPTIVRGDISITASGLTTHRGRPDQIEFPTKPPQSYTLEAEFTRISGEDSIAIGLVVGDSRCQFVIDAFPSSGVPRTGLEMLGGERVQNSRNPTVSQGSRLVNGKPAKLQCTVNGNRVTVTLDGQQVVDWTGDPQSLSLPRDYATGRKDRLTVSSWDSEFSISSFVLRPLESASEEAPSTDEPELVSDGFEIPTIAEQEAARKTIESSLGDQFTGATELEAKEKLAADLIKIAGDDAEKTPIRYVLFMEARRLAEETGKLALALAVIDQLDDRFKEIDPWLLKVESLNATKSAARGPARRQFAEDALALVDQALDRGQFEVADHAVQVAYAVAASAGTELRKAANDKRKIIAEVKPEWEAAKPAQERLQTDPENPVANKVWGVFLCLVQGNWNAGLKHLAKSSDHALRAAAEADVSMPRKVDDQIALADAWWDIAESYKDRKQDALKLRARTWYERASAFATAPLSKQKIENRLAETAALAGKSATTADPSRGLPRNVRAEYFGMVGGWLFNPGGTMERNLTAMPGLLRYNAGKSISEEQIQAMVKPVSDDGYSRRVRFALEGKVYAPIRTVVTVRHSGRGSSSADSAVLVDGRRVSAIANSYELRKNEVKITLNKGEHTVSWILNGKYGDIGDACKLEVVDEKGQPLTFYHSKEMLRAMGVRDVRVPGIHLGN